MQLALSALISYSAIAAFSGDARADQFRNSESLYQICSNNNPINREGCLEYVAAVIDTISLYQGVNVLERKLCIPLGATLGQATEIVVKYLTDHAAEQVMMTAAGMVILALREAWPCSAQ